MGRIGSTRISGIPKLIISGGEEFPTRSRGSTRSRGGAPGRETLAAVIRCGIPSRARFEVEEERIAHLLAAPMLQISLWRNSLEPCSDERIDPDALIQAHIDILSRGLAAERSTA